MTLHTRLAELAEATDLVVVSDYDGVLSPIVDDPAAAHPDERALRAFRSLANQPGTRCAIVSGRSEDVLRTFVGDDAAIELIGNHGASASGAHDADVYAATQDLRTLADRHPGAAVEEKPFGAALHVRHVRQAAPVIAEGRAIADRYGASTIDGKAVLEVTFGVGDKGTAVESLRTDGQPPIVFMGDDITDEAVFRVLNERDLGIKVGPGPTAAHHRIAEQSDVAPLLEHLDSLLTPP